MRTSLLAIVAVLLLTGIGMSVAMADAHLEAAIPPPPDPGPDYETWMVTCWEGDVEVVYETLNWTPPSWQTTAWRLTLVNRERIITSAPCRVTP